MDELPSGTVTFLFTDVEGSTALLKQLREHYAAGLAAHQRLVRDAFARHGGRELDTQGDAFFYAFRRARDAVLAALDAQRALRGYADWPGGAEFKVRMGVHTGQAEMSDGRYTGLAVHRAARICAAAHGGQVLISQATETLLADEEEDLQVRFRPLGQHRLKDLDRCNWSYFNSPRFNRRLSAASRLSGAARSRAFGKLDLELTRAAPAIAFTDDNALTLVSKRTGCVVLNPYLDLDAVCLR